MDEKEWDQRKYDGFFPPLNSLKSLIEIELTTSYWDYRWFFFPTNGFELGFGSLAWVVVSLGHFLRKDERQPIYEITSAKDHKTLVYSFAFPTLHSMRTLLSRRALN
jgi:hypothetical protein